MKALRLNRCASEMQHKILFPFAGNWIATMAERITESNSETTESKATNSRDKILEHAIQSKSLLIYFTFKC